MSDRKDGAPSPLPTGHDNLWLWFGLSRASWLTIPRVLMHKMPDEWQRDMARLLNEWDETWDTDDLPSPYVTARDGNKFTRWPSWVVDYRHPDLKQIELRRIMASQTLSERDRSDGGVK